MGVFLQQPPQARHSYKGQGNDDDSDNHDNDGDSGDDDDPHLMSFIWSL